MSRANLIFEKAKALRALVPEYVTIVAATKYAHHPDELDALIKAGITDFGENKIQTFIEHQAWLTQAQTEKVNWHFIGHLQKNKINKTLGQFSLIHSVDSFELAQVLAKANFEKGLNQNILLQVNLTQEEQKHGWQKHDLIKAFPSLLALKGMTIQGLMCFGHPSGHADMCLGVFEALEALSGELKAMFGLPDLKLSMGMSHDYAHALKFNATIIRIGQAVFG